MLYGRVYPFKASPRIHQGYTKRDPFCNALCYKYLPDAWTWQKRHMCRGVPFFPKTYARKLYIYRGGRQRAFLYVYIKKFFKKRVHPSLFRPLGRVTLWLYVRCSVVHPLCTLSRLHPFDVPSPKLPFHPPEGVMPDYERCRFVLRERASCLLRASWS